MNEPIIQLKGVVLNAMVLLKAVDDLHPNNERYLACLGPNGAGKTIDHFIDAGINRTYIRYSAGVQTTMPPPNQ